MVAELKLENDPRMTRFLDKIAEDMSPQRLKGLTGVTTSTPAVVQAEIKKLMATEAYNKESHPEHKTIVERVHQLYQEKHKGAA